MYSNSSNVEHQKNINFYSAEVCIKAYKEKEDALIGFIKEYLESLEGAKEVIFGREYDELTMIRLKNGRSFRLAKIGLRLDGSVFVQEDVITNHIHDINEVSLIPFGVAFSSLLNNDIDMKMEFFFMLQDLIIECSNFQMVMFSILKTNGVANESYFQMADKFFNNSVEANRGWMERMIEANQLFLNEPKVQENNDNNVNENQNKLQEAECEENG